VVVHAKMRKTVRLIFWIALLCLEIGLIIALYIVPQFQARNAPLGHWEGEIPRGPLLLLAGIALFVIFLVGNIGLVVQIWRRFKDLRVND
jgi:hypothetical protein